jgi:membrane protease YdiL (CAAX protease family)
VLAVPAVRAALAGPADSWSRAAVRAAAVIPMTTVLPEEFAFRGVLTGLLARRIGDRPALIATAGLFGLWHVLPGAAGGGAANDAANHLVGSGRRATGLRVAGTVLVTTGGGVLRGELRSRSGSLLAPVLLHWAINGLGELAVRRPPTGS